MAFNHLFNWSSDNKVRNFQFAETIRGRSTTQVSLGKILRTICSFSPPEDFKEPSLLPSFHVLELEKKSDRALFSIDLNLRLGSPPQPSEPENFEPPLADGGGGSVVGGADNNDPLRVSAMEKSSVGECDLTETAKLYGSESPVTENRKEAGIAREDVIEEVSEITTMEIPRADVDDNGILTETSEEKQSKIESSDEENRQEVHRSEEWLDLLIEAAKLISGDFEDDETVRTKTSPESSEVDETRKRRDSKTPENDTTTMRRPKRRSLNDYRTADACGDCDGDASPVVRSRSGRCQVLPYKYRDSVLEPWKPLSRHRSVAISTKRRTR